MVKLRFDIDSTPVTDPYTARDHYIAIANPDGTLTRIGLPRTTREEAMGIVGWLNANDAGDAIVAHARWLDMDADELQAVAQLSSRDAEIATLRRILDRVKIGDRSEIEVLRDRVVALEGNGKPGTVEGLTAEEIAWFRVYMADADRLLVEGKHVCVIKNDRAGALSEIIDAHIAAKNRDAEAAATLAQSETPRTADDLLKSLKADVEAGHQVVVPECYPGLSRTTTRTIGLALRRYATTLNKGGLVHDLNHRESVPVPEFAPLPPIVADAATGSEDESKPAPGLMCPDCGGFGNGPDRMNGNEVEQDKCPACDGAGVILTKS